MPSKSIREMSAFERRHYSLEARTFHAVLILSLILGAAAIAFGWSLYTYAVQDRYKTKVSELAVTIADIADGDVIAHYAAEAEKLSQVNSEQELYDTALKGYKDAGYEQLAETLDTISRNNHLSSAFIGIPDAEMEKFMFIVNTDESVRYREPGMMIVLDQAHRDSYEQQSEGPEGVILKQDDGGYACSAAAPIYTSSGDIAAYAICNLLITDVLRESLTFLWQYVLLLAIVAVILGYFMVRGLKKTVVRPINEIADAAGAYIDDRHKGIRGVRHFEDLHITTGDEIENLSLMMADMEKEIYTYSDNLMKITAEKERIGAELNVASQIQEGMLPCIFPPFPGRSEFDIYANMHTAKEVGGDFYDFFLIDDDHLALVMADVSGKGVPAALFMMASKILLNNFSVMGSSSPAVILEKVNHHICLNNSAEMFVTTWLGVLEISTGRLRAANAGHEYPALMRAGGKFKLYPDKHGFVLGGIDGTRYREYEIQLQEGDTLFLYTDGVPEATGDGREMFGTDRMLGALNTAPDSDLKDLLDGVTSAIHLFTGDVPQFDDITMLALRYRGKDMNKITLQAKTENLNQVLAFIDEQLEAADCPMKTQMQIDVAVEELFVNIAHYAYAPETGNVVVGIRVTQDDTPMARITFSDSGIPYNPLEKEDPDVTLSAEEREIGGLGIFMVKKTMDDILYDYINGQNILTILKKL